MKDKGHRPWLSVIAVGESLVSHAGGALLVEAARRSGLGKQLSIRLGRWRRPLAVHDPGKIVLDLAVAVALGGDAACDIAVLCAQPDVFGQVASDPTVSRLIATLAGDADAAVRAISADRAVAWERVWHVAGAPTQDGKVVIDLDATLITAHSDKQDATRTWKTFGFHPLLAYADHGTGGSGAFVDQFVEVVGLGRGELAQSTEGSRRRLRRHVLTLLARLIARGVLPTTPGPRPRRAGSPARALSAAAVVPRREPRVRLGCAGSGGLWRTAGPL